MNNLLCRFRQNQEALQSNQSAIEDDSMKFPDVAQLSGVRQITVANCGAPLAK